jgi:ribosomal protein S18 acetylase RimI-like enzyme
MSSACEDWRALDAADAVRLVSAEARAWRARLDWDVTQAWTAIEPARAAGRLPGLVARHRTGRPIGWACFLLHHECLQIAMLVAESADATFALVEGIMRSREAAQARNYALCVRDAAPGLRDALVAHGFDVTTYRYMASPTGDRCRPDDRLRAWRASDSSAVAQLCARAYARSRDVRAFALGGTAFEWQDYVAGLVTKLGCGRFLRDASFVSDPSRIGAGAAAEVATEIDGAIVTTDLGAGTAHVAQIAVDPGARGQGLGRALVQSAMGAVVTEGFVRMTLLVAEANAPAATLYEQLGFRDQSTFVVAANRQPRRSNKLALATGGASTRR